jgi:RNA polymerase sigma-70 factor (ECF subfamily)
LNVLILLSVLVVMLAISDAARGELADATVRQLYACHARALRRYVERFCADRSGADDIVQETFIRAWRHLPQLSSGDVPVRPWLFRVARNLLIDADRAARSRPVTVRAQPAEEGRDRSEQLILPSPERSITTKRVSR